MSSSGGASGGGGGGKGVSVMCDLSNSALNTQMLRDHAKAELEEILQMHRGSKLLIMDSHISKSLTHVLTDASVFFEKHTVVDIVELGDDDYFVNPNTVASRPPTAAPVHSFLKFGARANSMLDNVVVFVRPSLPYMRLVARRIHYIKAQSNTGKQQGGRAPYQASHSAKGPRFSVYFTPYKSLLCEKVLQDEGVYDLLSVGEFQLNWIPLERDVVSLEMGRCFRDCKLEKDMSCLEAVSKSITDLQQAFGKVRNFKSIGPMGQLVCQHLARAAEAKTAEPGGDAGASSSTAASSLAPGIDTLLLFDREVDMATPMVTPLTYEGLIDELIGINNGLIHVTREVAGLDKGEDDVSAQSGGTDADTELVPMYLNSNDKLFTEVRDLNIERIGPYLGQKAKEIRGSYDTFRSNKDATITQIHDFVKQIPGLKENYQSLSQHINVTEQIKRTTDAPFFRERWNTEISLLEGTPALQFIEDMISRQEPLFHVLRLLCLQSITVGGIRSNKFDSIRRDIIQTYGYEVLFTMTNLERLGLLRRREMQWMESTSQWASLRKAFNLIDEEIDVRNPRDVSFVSSGYAPLSVRIIQAAIDPGWPAYTSTLGLLPRPHIEFERIEHLGAALAAQGAPSVPPKPPGPSSANSMGDKKVMAIYFVGGITYMEIAALRFLNKQPDFPYQVIICTTKIINGSTFLKSLVGDVGDGVGWS